MSGERGRHWQGCLAPLPSGRRRAFGFSLIELIVVMTVTLVLTGLLLPALVQVRENAHRVICSSNLRQVGLAAVMFADDNNALPPSEFGEPGGSKQEMMAVHRGGSPGNWEGLGWLHAREYFKGPQVLYCPSHVGDHTFQRYQQQYLRLQRHPDTVRAEQPDVERIYSNYHYAGPKDWERQTPRRLDRRLVIATDGLRSVRDFNHKVGMNVLRGDNSVTWLDDTAGQIRQMLPAGLGDEQGDDEDLYARIWDLIGGDE